MKPKKHTHNKTKVSTANARPVTQGHALDGSQQLDIVEEQLYTLADGSAKDHPLVEKEAPENTPLPDHVHDISVG
ncbi:hypothetical protein [Glaciimonas soli]|uniref:Uncharacterized protein n=1 Tax=Glaciimonas soli TaxID=2590999 RepID=A0A843YKI7_9BURK|nr:hypothetical protein [Glaciimonas soli]MQQ99904.1 hypothetical protein [Glaciimonas soli]